MNRLPVLMLAAMALTVFPALPVTADGGGNEKDAPCQIEYPEWCVQQYCDMENP